MRKKVALVNKKKKELVNIFKVWFIILASIIIAIILFLNLQASQRMFFSKRVISGLSDVETLIFLKKTDPKFFDDLKKCCLDQKTIKEIENYYEKKRSQINMLEEAYKKNPYDWRVLKNLAILYEEVGELKKANYYKNLYKEFYP